jgi:hypothetical protein
MPVPKRPEQTGAIIKLIFQTGSSVDCNNFCAGG